MWREVKENAVHCTARKMKKALAGSGDARLFISPFHGFRADVVDALALNEGSKEEREKNVH